MATDNLALETYIYEYMPPGVQRIIGIGSSAFIGAIDEYTVLKYPLQQGGDVARLKIESRLLEIVGEHPNIIKMKGFREDQGLLLEYATNGSLSTYIDNQHGNQVSLEQRLVWCREVVEALVHIHSKKVIHCDIRPENLLLDTDLHIKLSDFQGQHISEDGVKVLDGEAAEGCRFSCPRDDPSEANITTDLFALGCTIYVILVGTVIFPDIIDGEKDWYEKVENRFRAEQFPEEPHPYEDVTMKCWRKQYKSAAQVLRDMEDRVRR